MIDPALVFDSVRRGYNDLELSSNSEILDYFGDIDSESMIGHISNIKGILFEQLYVEQLANQGIHAEIFESTNHPVTDVVIFEDGEIINEVQLKATDSVSYINETILENPDIAIVTTAEIGNRMGEEVIATDIENSALEESVVETLGTDDFFNPLSPIGWFFGIF